MKSFVALLCLALLSTATPLGDRALIRKHTGAPLSRRFILASRFDAPAACSSGFSPANFPNGNSNITTPDVPPLNSTSTSTDNSTVTDSGNDETGDDSGSGSGTEDPDDTSDTTDDEGDDASSNSTTVTKRYLGFDDFSAEWLDVCSLSGSEIFGESDPCIDYAVNGFSALFADADVCAQQNIADQMITFAKSRSSHSSDLINVAVGYRKLARESVQLFGFYPSTPYCTEVPVNDEIKGVWNAQPEGVTTGLFGGPNVPITPFGGDGSCPRGQTPNVNSCTCMFNFFGNMTLTGTLNTTSSDFPPSGDYSDDSSSSGNSTNTDTGSSGNSTSTDTGSSGNSTSTDTGSSGNSTSTDTGSSDTESSTDSSSDSDDSSSTGDDTDSTTDSTSGDASQSTDDEGDSTDGATSDDSSQDSTGDDSTDDDSSARRRRVLRGYYL